MLLEMQNVVKRFGGLTAVSNMSFHVEKGEIFGVIGPNGAGKTTIFNLLTGVYPVSEGNILFYRICPSKWKKGKYSVSSGRTAPVKQRFST